MILSELQSLATKTSGLYFAYGTMAFLSLILFVGLFFAKQKSKWLLGLFGCVSVVNTGYLMLSLAKSLPFALFCNAFSYLGSVFLPFFMLMQITQAPKIKVSKAVVTALVAVGFAMLLLTSSPGILDVYYKSAELVTQNGVSVLKKEYGVLHITYLFYLVGYFAAMITVAIYSIAKKKTSGATHSAILIAAVFINLAVWLLEQFIETHYELLSVSYVVCELFLLGITFLQAPAERVSPPPQKPLSEQGKLFLDGLSTLTAAERAIYELHISGISSKEIMTRQSISENTLKYHNRNIYGKLGVSGKKELVAIARELGAASK